MARIWGNCVHRSCQVDMPAVLRSCLRLMTSCVSECCWQQRRLRRIPHAHCYSQAGGLQRISTAPERRPPVLDPAWSLHVRGITRVELPLCSCAACRLAGHRRHLPWRCAHPHQQRGHVERRQEAADAGAPESGTRGAWGPQAGRPPETLKGVARATRRLAAATAATCMSVPKLALGLCP